MDIEWAKDGITQKLYIVQVPLCLTTFIIIIILILNFQT